jgi:hypothetical protein
MDEILDIKQRLATDDVAMPIGVLEKAILLPLNDSSAVDNPKAARDYPEISTLLFKNPFETKKKKKKKGKKKKKR